MIMFSFTTQHEVLFILTTLHEVIFSLTTLFIRQTKIVISRPILKIFANLFSGWDLIMLSPHLLLVPL